MDFEKLDLLLSENKYSEFIKTVDGYSITIRVVEEGWGYINCYITVSTV